MTEMTNDARYTALTNPLESLRDAFIELNRVRLEDAKTNALYFMNHFGTLTAHKDGSTATTATALLAAYSAGAMLEKLRDAQSRIARIIEQGETALDELQMAIKGANTEIERAHSERAERRPREMARFS